MRLPLEGGPVELLPEDVLVQRQENAGLTVANDGDLTVALDTALTPARDERRRVFPPGTTFTAFVMR